MDPNRSPRDPLAAFLDHGGLPCPNGTIHTSSALSLSHLAISHNKLAAVFLGLKKPEKAYRLYMVSSELWARLRKHEDQVDADIRKDSLKASVTTLRGLGTVEELRSNPEGPLEFYLRAEKELEGPAARDPELMRPLLLVRETRCLVQAYLGQHEAAIAALKQVEAIRKKAAAEDSRGTWAPNAHAWTWTRIRKIQGGAGKLAEALASLETRGE